MYEENQIVEEVTNEVEVNETNEGSALSKLKKPAAIVLAIGAVTAILAKPVKKLITNLSAKAKAKATASRIKKLEKEGYTVISPFDDFDMTDDVSNND